MLFWLFLILLLSLYIYDISFLVFFILFVRRAACAYLVVSDVVLYCERAHRNENRFVVLFASSFFLPFLLACFLLYTTTTAITTSSSSFLRWMIIFGGVYFSRVFSVVCDCANT